MTTENTIPQIYGKDLKIVEIDGPRGQFGVAPAGSLPELGTGYFYQDKHGRFFFYEEFVGRPAVARKVTYAGTGARPGIPFKTTAENESYFRQNIEFFFKTRVPFDPIRLRDESDAALPVTFSWRIVQ